MNLMRLALILGLALALRSPLAADDNPFTMAKAYAADVVITQRDGTTITNHVVTDGGKIRTEMNMQGISAVSIIRPDQDKIYSVVDSHKMVMVMPYDPAKYKREAATVTGPEGKFELVGPDKVSDLDCTKYKVSNRDNRIYDMWISNDGKGPVKMAAEDGSVTVLWKNFAEGPQDPAKFEPPKGYQVMNMPDVSGMMAPGGH